MPNIRKLEANEVATIERKALGMRKAIEVEYDRILDQFAPGDWGEAELSDTDNRLTVRNRLKRAAQRKGIGIVFQRTRGDEIRFKIVTASEMDAGGVDGSEDTEGDGDGDSDTLAAFAPTPSSVPAMDAGAAGAQQVPPAWFGSEPEPAPVGSDAPPAKKPGRPRNKTVAAADTSAPAVSVPAPSAPAKRLRGDIIGKRTRE